jgi:hypothetical protein
MVNWKLPRNDARGSGEWYARLEEQLRSRRYFSCPKTSASLRLQLTHSRRSSFTNLRRPKSQVFGQLWGGGDARCLDTEAGMGGYPGLRCVKIYLLSYGCITNGDGCCTKLTESIVEGPAVSIWPASRMHPQTSDSSRLFVGRVGAGFTDKYDKYRFIVGWPTVVSSRQENSCATLRCRSR